MQYERFFKKTATFPLVNGKRTLTFVPTYSDAQLQQLGEAVQVALGEGSFVSFHALDGEDGATHAITVAWNEVSPADEVAAIDAVFVAWMEGI